jgi:hypothetical protein
MLQISNYSNYSNIKTEEMKLTTTNNGFQNCLLTEILEFGKWICNMTLLIVHFFDAFV